MLTRGVSLGMMLTTGVSCWQMLTFRELWICHVFFVYIWALKRDASCAIDVAPSVIGDVCIDYSSSKEPEEWRLLCKRWRHQHWNLILVRHGNLKIATRNKKITIRIQKYKNIQRNLNTCRPIAKRNLKIANRNLKIVQKKSKQTNIWKIDSRNLKITKRNRLQKQPTEI